MILRYERLFNELIGLEGEADISLVLNRFSGSVTLSGGKDWKATLKLPPPDTRYQTAVDYLLLRFGLIIGLSPYVCEPFC